MPQGVGINSREGKAYPKISLQSFRVELNDIQRSRLYIAGKSMFISNKTVNKEGVIAITGQQREVDHGLSDHWS